MKELKLKSGAVLRVDLASFADGKSLFQSVAEEITNVQIKSGAQEIDYNFIKGIVCTGVASKKIEAGVWACMKKAHYNDVKITPETFEPMEARRDYLDVFTEVLMYNIEPFTSDLFSVFSRASEKFQSSLK